MKGATPSPPLRGHYTVPALPVAAGVPGAAQQPNAVGSDPRLIHFGIGTMTLPTDTARWAVNGGVESLDFSLTSAAGYPESVQVRMAHGQTVPAPTKSDLGASPPAEEQRPVKVGSHTATLITQTTYLNAPGASTATLVTRILRWQPVAGVTVEVSSGLDQTELLAVASTLPVRHRVAL